MHPLVPVDHCLNSAAYLSIVADHVHTFTTSVHSVLMAASGSSCHLTVFLNMTMSNFCTQTTSTITTSQSNRAPIGCGGMEDEVPGTGSLHYEGAAKKN